MRLKNLNILIPKNLLKVLKAVDVQKWVANGFGISSNLYAILQSHFQKTVLYIIIVHWYSWEKLVEILHHQIWKILNYVKIYLNIVIMLWKKLLNCDVSSRGFVRIPPFGPLSKFAGWTHLHSYDDIYCNWAMLKFSMGIKWLKQTCLLTLKAKSKNLVIYLDNLTRGFERHILQVI